jgi:hypothetical protein
MQWHQANPHRFHLLTLGTLHALPSPVKRRGQKVFKPEWFEVHRKERDAWDGVSDARNWAVALGTVGTFNHYASLAAEVDLREKTTVDLRGGVRRR